MDASAALVRHDAKVLGLISVGHFLSHFYMLSLPTLFIFLNRDLGIAYTLLGVLLSARYVATGVTQTPVGFLVDRYGAKVLLIAGMLLMVTAFTLLALVSNFWLLLLLVILVGIGDAVFHPADYAILNGSISAGRMGRAFSIHTFSGHLGFAAAPVVITLLSSLWDWRVALIIVGALSYAVVGVLITQWSNLEDDTGRVRRDEEDVEASIPMRRFADHTRLLTSRPVILLFSFFAMSTLAGNALSSFAIPALNALHQVSAVNAGFAVSTFMFVSSLAVLVGGKFADDITRHDRFAAGMYLLFIVAVLSIPLLGGQYYLVILFFGVAGFCHGVIRPARDLMVREVAPPGSTGKVFGFIFTGQNVGGGIAPLILGTMMDRFPPQWIFFTGVVFAALCILTIMVPRSK